MKPSKAIALAVFLLVGCAILGTTTRILAEDYDSLIAEAEAKYTEKDYAKALELVRKAFEIGEPALADFYNAACIAALAGESDAAFDYLTKAVEAGLAGKDWETAMEEDADLASLRTDPRWEALKASVVKNYEEALASLPETRVEGPVLDLPAPQLAGETSVEEALQNRRSIRSYLDVPVTLAEVSQLLWSAYGITRPVENGPGFLRGGLRTAPAAGALYPLELYLVARNVTSLAPGVYYYKSETHQLVLVSAEDRWEALAEAGLSQPHFQTAAAAIVYSAVFERNTSKYGQRGRERYVCMDLGHSAENVYLQAVALKIGTCAIGAFGDLALQKAVGMTRAEEPLYIMPFGKVE
jgi:SagB-type dehydrogenase family enzyme